MSHNRVPMTYDAALERWCVELGGKRYGLHCGEHLRLHVSKQTLDCRLELDTAWYAMTGDVTLSLRQAQHHIVSL